MSKGNGIGERKPTWNNVQRVNKQNQFVPLAVQTRTRNNPVSTAKASSTNNFSTARQNVNRQTVLTSIALKVNTVKPIVVTPPKSGRSGMVKEVSTVGGKWDTAIKSSAVDVPQAHDREQAYLADFQDFNGALFDFGVVKRRIITWIKREYSNARTPQQNGVAERKNRTLIEAAGTCLPDSFLPNTFLGTKDKIDAGDSEKEDESNQDCFELPIWHSYSSTNSFASKSDNKIGGPREEEQVFLHDLARLQRQEKKLPEEAKASQEESEPATENLVTSEQELLSLAITASPNEELSISDTTNSQEDDSEIPPLEDIHE
ncbi:putative ribonuclease H-like domain-containing protein [Tanacetum coccineum]